MMDKIFLHTCCAGCASGVIYTLMNEFKVKPILFFYNPNIQPEGEYLKRKEALTRLAEETKLSLEIPEYKPEDHLLYINSPEKLNDRCYYCYYLRLSRAFIKARMEEYSLFSTTLLASPHQNHLIIKGMCEDLASKYGVRFLYFDFRKKYYEYLEPVKKLGLYRQKYCGCNYSISEKAK